MSRTAYIGQSVVTRKNDKFKNLSEGKLTNDYSN